MKKSDINHLYRLLGWVRCEIGQTPDEMVSTMRAIADKIGPIDIPDERKKDIVEAHDRARLVPKYIRDAVKALEKNCRAGDVIEGGTDEVLQISADAQSAELAALRAKNVALTADLTVAAATLRRYETLHRAKGTADSTAKAEVNAELAARFEATIARAIERTANEGYAGGNALGKAG